MITKITRQEAIEFLSRISHHLKQEQKDLSKKVAKQEASVYDLKRKNKDINISDGLIKVFQSIKVDPLDLIDTPPPPKKQKELFKNPI
jgi:replicative DNA helicase